MNRLILLLSIIITLFGCNTNSENQTKNSSKPMIPISQNESKKQIKTNENVETFEEYQIGYYSTNGAKYYYKEVYNNETVTKVKYDYLDIDTLMINGGFNQYSKVDTLLAKFGMPDSSKVVESYEYEKTLYFYDFGTMKMSHNDSLVYCGNMKFLSNNRFIQYDTLKFNSLTSIKDFEKLFPLSYLNREVNRQYENDLECDWIRLTTKQDLSRGDEFIFIFHDKRLKYFSYFDGND